MEWGVRCMFISLDYNIRGLFGKAGFIPIMNNWFDENRRWRRWLKTGGLHIVWIITDVLIGLYIQDKVISGDRPDVLGDRTNMRGPLSCIGHMGRGKRCLRFRSDPERTSKWMCVWHWFFFCVDWSLLNIYLFGGGKFILLLNTLLWDVRAQRLYIDRHQSHGMNCQCGMPRCKWSRLLFKGRALWLMIKAQL